MHHTEGRFTRSLIILSFWVSAFMFLLTGVYYLVMGLYFAGALGVFFALIYMLAWFGWKSRIPFSTELLVAVIRIMKMYPMMFVFVVVAVVLQAAYTLWWSVTLYAVDYRWGWQRCQVGGGSSTAGCQSTAGYGWIIAFMALSFYWTTQLMKDVLHIAIAGTFATHYFFYGTAQGVPRYNAALALRRACTTSFGSACFGSLVLTLVQLVRIAIQELARQQDGILAFVACCAACLMGWVEGLVRWFNRYAYS
jgi:hypothetical protein